MEKKRIKEVMGAFMRFRQAWLRFGAAEGLSGREMFVLKMIAERDGASTRCARVTDLCETLGMGKSNMSQILNHLEDKKLIERIAASDDRRVVRIALTESGEDQLRISSEAAEEFFDEIARRMGDEDMERFVGLLHRISAIIKEIKDEARTHG